MVTCIVASTFGLVFTIISSIGLGVSSHGPYRYNSDHSHSSVAGLYGFQVSKEKRNYLVSTGSLIKPIRGTAVPACKVSVMSYETTIHAG